MTIIDSNSIIIVPPFECAWLSGEDLLFPQPGRGCVCFEARADNDITLTFKEHAGLKHYRMDLDRNYTVVLGSHRNRLFKIEADGNQVAEVAVGISNSAFERYWIDVCNGVITVGKGNPGQGMQLRWSDPNPNLSLQYVGLSSWDKHVSYRSVKVIRTVNFKEKKEYEPSSKKVLSDYLMSSSFADVKFVVGKKKKMICAHKLILACCCFRLKFAETHSKNGVECIELPSTKPSILKLLLKYAYTGRIKVFFSKIIPLLELSNKFGFISLSQKCIDSLKVNKSNNNKLTNTTTATPSLFSNDDQSIKTSSSIVQPSSSSPSSSSSSSSSSSILQPSALSSSISDFHPSPLLSSSEETSIDMVYSNCNESVLEKNDFFLFNDLPIDKVKLEEAFIHGDFSDVSLFVENQTSSIKSHRLFLSLISPLFSNMFRNDMKESRCGNVIIGDCSFQTLKSLLCYFYTSKFNTCIYNASSNECYGDDDYDYDYDDDGDDDMKVEKNILFLHLLSMADRFCLNKFKAFVCEKIISSVDMESACSVLSLSARIPNCDKLCNHCERIIAKNFDFYVSNSLNVDFQNLTFESVKNILNHNEMTVSSEENVLDAVIMWSCVDRSVNGFVDFDLTYGNESNILTFLRPEVSLILPLVRFPLMPLELLNKLQSTSFSTQIPIFKSLLEEAFEYFDSSLSNNLDLTKYHKIEGCYVKKIDDCFRFTHRLSNFHKLFYTKDGDDNGVCYFVGSYYGMQKWMNPVLSKRLIITSSSPFSRFTDPKSLVSGNFQNTSFVGPCAIFGEKNSFWKFDFGENHQLMCNYYTLRQDGSSNFPRNWVIEASVDDVNWVELRRHENDQTLSCPGQYASFSIVGSKSYFAARYFRIRMYGPSSNKSNPWYLCLCYIEFYGYFR